MTLPKLEIGLESIRVVFPKLEIDSIRLQTAFPKLEIGLESIRVVFPKPEIGPLRLRMAFPKLEIKFRMILRFFRTLTKKGVNDV